MELTEYHKAKIRQTASNLLGSDARVFLKTRDLGPGLKEVQILVESLRVLEDKAEVKSQLRERLSEPLKEFTTKLVLIDPDVTLRKVCETPFPGRWQSDCGFGFRHATANAF